MHGGRYDSQLSILVCPNILILFDCYFIQSQPRKTPYNVTISFREATLNTTRCSILINTSDLIVSAIGTAIMHGNAVLIPLNSRIIIIRKFQ